MPSPPFSKRTAVFKGNRTAQRLGSRGRCILHSTTKTSLRTNPARRPRLRIELVQLAHDNCLPNSLGAGRGIILLWTIMIFFSSSTRISHLGTYPRSDVSTAICIATSFQSRKRRTRRPPPTRRSCGRRGYRETETPSAKKAKRRSLMLLRSPRPSPAAAR